MNQEIGYAHDKVPIIILRDQGVSLTGFVYGFDTIDLSADGAQEAIEKLITTLRELMHDGRLTNVALAQRAGITPPPCLRRVRALEKRRSRPSRGKSRPETRQFNYLQSKYYRFGSGLTDWPE